MRNSRALPYQDVFGLNGDSGAHRIHVNKEYGLQIDTITKRKVAGDIYSGWKKEKRIYSLRGGERNFKTPDQLVRCLHGESLWNPNND